MREKKRCRWLALLLAVVMLLSVLPTAVFAGEESGNTFYRIFHLDCGRKYFSVDQIKALIDTLAENHYTHIELAVGNDGLRFLLDDMSVTANDITYTSDAVRAGIQAGNKAYYNAGTYNELTQTEMDTIISYANEKGIGIIPLINTPGHMDAILDCMEYVGISNPAYNNSARTVDVTKPAAVNFTLALVNKYIQYFAGKGCTRFNMGCDEYANDVSNSGFAGLISSKKYGSFITYVNDMAAQVEAAGMTPMAFNDGIYYNSNTSFGTFDSKIVIAYWTSGFSGYSPASASFLAGKGHKIINTNDAWYYVLGRQAGNSSGYTIATAQNGVQNTACTDIPGDNDPGAAGCMICLWCDTPRASYNSTEVSNVTGLLTTFATNNPTYFVASGETDPTDPGEGTENKTITVTVGQTVTDTISGYNFAGTYTTEDPSIATVEVTGKDAVEATTTYTQASVTCDTLISSNSDSWKAASDYYYTPDGTNYYPVYAMRSGRFGNRTYTWGYSTTSSASNVTQIGTQKAYFFDTPDITVYTKSVTDGTPASTTVTFTGVAVGTTYVTVGNTRYTIKVVAEDLSGVTPLTVEYWITNLPVTADGATSKAISAQSAYGEAGVDVSTLVPATGTYDWGNVVFWKATVLDANNHQTTAGGDDETADGKDFTMLRYYNNSWQYFYDNAWNSVNSTDQVVIYWLQPTKVTKEITTLVKDWGYTPDKQGDTINKVALSFAVVYPDGTLSPAESAIYGTSTILYNYDNVSRKSIGLVAPVNNSDYEISKITVTSGTRDQSGTGKWGVNDTITWDKVENEAGDMWYNETTYWDETVGGTPMVNGDTQGIYWTDYNTAKLVLIYLKPIHYDTNLIVNWVDDSDSGALISTMEVAVSSDGTPITFYNGLKQTSALPTEGVGGTFTLDDNAYVTNSSNVNQTFNKNISTVPGVADKYKSGLYMYVSADLSADGKTLTLHYNIDASKLSKTFVVDFGLPISIPLSEFLNNPEEASVTLEENCVSPDYAGYANYDESNSSIVFTPRAVLNDAVAISVKVTYTGNRQETLRIGILPASNVLYEDNFLTEDETHDYAIWNKVDAAASVPQSADQGALYGYDVAYVPEAGSVAPSNSMGSAWTIAGLSTGKGSQYLTTTFTGNGFDLIGTAGPDTGYVYVLLKPKDGSTAKLYVVDTSYVDGSNTTLTQVPLLHTKLDTQGTYDVTIRAAYRKPTEAADSGDTGTQVSRAAAFSMSAAPTSPDSVYDVVDAFFADGFEIDDVEYVYFDDASALAELENASRATYAMSYALDSATAAATADAEVNTTERPEGTTVTIDGFRVYRSTENSAYSDNTHNEYGAAYVNVAEAVLNGTFTAFTENGSSDWTSVKDYHDAGGPKWEVYLDRDLAIAFKVDTTSPVQISARAIDDPAVMKVNDTEVTLTSKTEMYYEVTPNEDGIVAIQATSGKLAIANIKMPAGTQTTALTDDEITKVVPMLLRMAAAPGEPDPVQPGNEEPAPKPVFTPETFKTKVSSLRTRSRKIVTLTITASTDVDHVVVNGKTYYPMNKLLVRLGWSKTCVFTIVDTAGASETRNFEIVAYNDDGLASITYTDAG